MNAKAVKVIRKVERPRPLRSTSSETTLTYNDIVSKKNLTAEVLPELEKLFINVTNCSFDEKAAEDINKMCNLLKMYGQEIDLTMKNLLNHYFVTFRNISREDRLDAISRLRLLEIIELKAMGWQINENIVAYYRRKIVELEGAEKNFLLSTSSSSSQVFTEPSSVIGVPLAPGEIIRSSGKFMNPTKIAGKNYFKDEVVIRNSDSGKVNPGARDRRVQIAGPTEESISYAKTLVEDTIRKNASPVREQTDNNSNLQPSIPVSNINFEDDVFPKHSLMHSLSMGDATIGEYTEYVSILGDRIKICGKNVDSLKMIKKVLQEYFSAQEFSTNLNQRMSYSDSNKSDLLKTSRTSLRRSSSWLDSTISQTSLSPLDTSSEEEVVRDCDLTYKTVDCEESSFPYEISNDNDLPLIPPPRNIQSRKTYSQQFMLRCRESPFSKVVPHFREEIYEIYPMMIRDSGHSDYLEIKNRSLQNSQDAEMY